MSDNINEKPLLYQDSVDDPKYYFGRRKLFENILASLSESRSVVLKGDRRVGKTSTLKVLERFLSDLGSRPFEEWSHVTKWVEFPDRIAASLMYQHSQIHVMAELINEMIHAFDKTAGRLPMIGYDAACKSLMKYLKEREETHHYFLFDEIETWIFTATKHDPLTITRFSDLLKELPPNCQIIMSMADTFPYQHEWGSRLDVFQISPLDAEESEELTAFYLDQPALSAENLRKLQTELWEWSGGWPLFLKYYINQIKTASDNFDGFENHADEMLTALADIFSTEWYEHLTDQEKSLIKEVMETNPDENQLDPSRKKIAHNLKERGFLEKNQSLEKIRIRGNIWQHWLHRRFPDIYPLTSESHIIIFGDGEVTVNGIPKSLTENGYDLLRYLAERMPDGISAAELADKLFGNEHYPDEPLKDVIDEIHSIIEPDPANPYFLKKVGRTRYCLDHAELKEKTDMNNEMERRYKLYQRQAIPSEEPYLYFGRKEMIRKIIRNIISFEQKSFLLKGERRIGKTSTLNLISALMNENETDFGDWQDVRQYVFTLLEERKRIQKRTFEKISVRKIDWQLYKKDWGGFLNSIRSSLGIDKLSDNSLGEIYREISSHVEKNNKIRFVLLVDEMDAFINLNQEAMGALISGLVDFIERNDITFIFAAPEYPLFTDIKKGTHGSHLTGRSISMFIEPLDIKELKFKIQYYLSSLSEQQINEIYSLTGGCPLIVKYVLQKIWSQKDKNTEMSLKKIELELNRDKNISDQFRNIWHKHFSPSQKLLIESIVKFDDDETDQRVKALYEKSLTSIVGKEEGDVRYNIVRDTLKKRGLIESLGYDNDYADGIAYNYKLRGNIWHQWVISALKITPLKVSTNQNNQIFLCHANEDKIHVRKINKKLNAKGFTTWLDEKDILPGQPWRQTIKKAIENSDFILVFLSENSVSKRGYIQKEIKMAIDILDECPKGDIFLIPVLIENCEIPEILEPYHGVRLFEKNGFQKLVNALNTQLNVRNDKEKVIPKESFQMQSLISDVSSQFEKMINPYQAGESIKEPNYFYGGKNLISDILSKLAYQPQNFLIQGPRRTGKSSILNMIERCISDSSVRRRFDLPDSWNDFINRCKAIKVSLQQISSQLVSLDKREHEFYRLLIQEIKKIEVWHGNEEIEEWWEKGCDLKELPVKIFKGLLEEIILTNPHISIIFLIDEFDEMNALLQVGFHAGLRAIIDNVPRCAWIVVQAYGMQSWREVYGSPLLNLFEKKNINVLSRDDAIAMINDPIRESHIAYLNDACDDIIRNTGGHPYFTSLLCSKIIELLNRKYHTYVVDKNHVELATTKLIRDRVSSSIRYMWDHPEKWGRALLTAYAAEGHAIELNDVLKKMDGIPELSQLAQKEGDTPSRLVMKESKRVLEIRVLTGMNDEIMEIREDYIPAGKAWFTVPLFGQWIERHFIKDGIVNWNSVMTYTPPS